MGEIQDAMEALRGALNPGKEGAGRLLAEVTCKVTHER